MASLRAHLRRSEHHGRLSFHPDCPLCHRERLSGVITAQPLLPRRTQAALAASVLVFSAAAPSAPAAAAAVPPDQLQDELAPEPAPNDDSTHAPDFDPGGPSVSLPDASTAPAPTSPPMDDSDNGPVDTEPANDPPNPATGPGNAKQAVPTQPQAPAPSPTPSVSESGVPASRSGGGPSPTPAARQSPRVGAPSEPGIQGHRRRPRTSHSVRPGGASSAESSAADLPARSAPAGSSSTSSPPKRHSQGHDASDKSVHVVVAGESLWTIARGLLGRDASDAHIAREVHRLWELNQARIATGNPNLLPIGARLLLA